MIIYITWFLTTMLYRKRANKTSLITLNSRGNLHFIRWRRFEIVCCRRLKRGNREKETETWIKNETHDFPFDTQNSNCLYCIITSYDFPSVCLKIPSLNVMMLKKWCLKKRFLLTLCLLQNFPNEIHNKIISLMHYLTSCPLDFHLLILDDSHAWKQNSPRHFRFWI